MVCAVDGLKQVPDSIVSLPSSCTVKTLLAIGFCTLRQYFFEHFSEALRRVTYSLSYWGSKWVIIPLLFIPGVMKTRFANFCNFSQLPLSNSLFTVLFAYVFFLLGLWLGICGEVDVDRITILPPSPPLPIFSSPTILCLTQVTVIWNKCAPKAGLGAV